MEESESEAIRDVSENYKSHFDNNYHQNLQITPA